MFNIKRKTTMKEEITEERKQEILNEPIKKEYFENAEEAIKGGLENKAISEEGAALAREVNAKLKEINTAEAVLMIISNCALLLNPIQCMALEEICKHVARMKVVEMLKERMK